MGEIMPRMPLLNSGRPRCFVAGMTAVMLLPAAVAGTAGAADASGIEFFEKHIQPLLTQNCFECHSHDQKIKGGLRLDLRDGWAGGGDSGPALVPGDPEASLIIKAVRYTDRDLKMPPKRRLAPEQVALLEEWVRMGAPDPRVVVAAGGRRQEGMSVEDGRKFWSFVPPKETVPPAVKAKAWPRTDIDRFILAQLEERGLTPVTGADRATLIRRAYFDLIGLPPTPEQIDAFVNDARPEAFERVIDELLASPHYGERWGRHWLDVARFAESSGGGRTLLFKDAWRYRDYVIESFNRDVPFDQFIREQIAGDLLPHATADERRRQLIATGYLALGPTNYEEQDKGALRMDIVDEQLDTVGKGLLGMTIGCARCHDHKFDPIPTKDYYAMAGILRSTGTLFNYTDNVARWVDVPLPMDPAQEAALQAHETKLAALKDQIAAAKRIEKRASANVTRATDMMKGVPIAPDALAGIVVDDAQAKVVGEWKHSQFSKSYIGEGYLADLNTGKGEKTVTFVPPIPRSGRYEVRLAYSALDNRSANTPVTVFHADGEHTIPVDQRDTPPIGGRFVSLGQYRFEKGGEGYVLISNEGTKGHVIVDAVQFIPVEELAAEAVLAGGAAGDEDDAAKAAAADVRRLEAELKQLTAAGPARPLAMSVREEEDTGDTRVHIRGSIRNLGEPVPRGFLTVASPIRPPAIPADRSGRRELAEWIASPANPLTARVFANRAWTWLFGSGLVRTADNFGTTGEPPSHPELLDHLALRFIADGWSVKQLVKQIMLSQTYQLASDVETLKRSSVEAGAVPDGSNASALERFNASTLDPENRLFWRQNRRRMEAEQLRDTILSVSGELKLDLGGPNIAGAGKIDANTTAAQNTEYNYVFADTRRSVYTPAFRNRRLELFEVFDFGDINAPIGKRNASTVAPQALYLMNHPFVIEQARRAAERALAVPGLDDARRISRAYRVALGRLPAPRERELARQFVTVEASEGPNEAQRLEAWAQLYQSLFACVDFRYIN
jgi:hypothetical protein